MSPPDPSRSRSPPRMWGATGTAQGHVLMARRGRPSPPLAPICTPTSRDTLPGSDHQACPARTSGLCASGSFFPNLFTAQEASPPTSSFFSSVRVAFSFQFGSSTLSFLETPLISSQIHSAGRAVLLENTQQTGFVLWVWASEGSLQPARPDSSAPGAGASMGQGLGCGLSAGRLRYSLTRSRELQAQRR